MLCADAALGRDWAWTAYLPHTRPRADGECRNLVGLLTAEGDQVRRRVAELTALVARRTEPQQPGSWPRGEARTASSCSTAPSGCALSRVCPCCFGTARRSASTSSAWTPTRHGSRSRRVRWCRSSRDTPSRLTVDVAAAAAVKDVAPDAVSDRWAHRFARALARLRDATPDADRPQVPDARPAPGRPGSGRPVAGGRGRPLARAAALHLGPAGRRRCRALHRGPAPRRSPRAGRRDDGLGQVRAAADAHRLPGAGEPAR